MMDAQMAPPPYTAAGNPPMLGQQIPGMTGGLPALSGLSVTGNPMAQELQNQGRDEDTMLVHMTPNEVNSLQGLAMAHGGSLTINPNTGLPEAGFLKKLLPTLLGAGLMLIPGVNALAAAGMVAGGSVLKTGSLKKGLMAGLQAYGGASLAGGLGAGSVFGAAKTAVPAVPAGFGSSANMAREVAANAAKYGQVAGTTAAKTGLAGIAQGFGTAAKAGIPAGAPAFISKAAPMLAASGLMQGVSGAMTPSGGGMVASDGRIDNSYQGPYYAQDRQRILDPEGPLSSKQRRHFAIDMPEIYNTSGQVVQPGSQTVRGTQIMQPVLNPNAKKGQPMYSFMPTTYMGGVAPREEEEEEAENMGYAPNQDDMGNYAGYAHGGEVQLADGAFVLDARTVSELGNGSSNAGMEALSRMGGQPVQGPGDGVSDSIPARIGRNQPARVARDEVIMPANVVRRIGKGSPERGANKLYSLMNKAHTARKKAGRGQDTKLRRGLG